MSSQNDYCDQHIQTVTKLATIEERIGALIHSFDDVKERMVCHINEGERPGGMRERAITMEKDIQSLKKEISAIKKGYWIAAVVGGFVGGLISQLTPETFQFIIKLLK